MGIPIAKIRDVKIQNTVTINGIQMYNEVIVNRQHNPEERSVTEPSLLIW